MHSLHPGRNISSLHLDPARWRLGLPGHHLTLEHLDHSLNNFVHIICTSTPHSCVEGYTNPLLEAVGWRLLAEEQSPIHSFQKRIQTYSHNPPGGGWQPKTPTVPNTLQFTTVYISASSCRNTLSNLSILQILYTGTIIPDLMSTTSKPLKGRFVALLAPWEEYFQSPPGPSQVETRTAWSLAILGLGAPIWGP